MDKDEGGSVVKSGNAPVITPLQYGRRVVRHTNYLLFVGVRWITSAIIIRTSNT